MAGILFLFITSNTFPTSWQSEQLFTSPAGVSEDIPFHRDASLTWRMEADGWDNMFSTVFLSGVLRSQIAHVKSMWGSGLEICRRDPSNIAGNWVILMYYIRLAFQFHMNLNVLFTYLSNLSHSCLFVSSVTVDDLWPIFKLTVFRCEETSSAMLIRECISTLSLCFGSWVRGDW